jgi:tRNA(adenine34) deaminase
MRLALEEAQLALNEQEVPVGAVLVKDNQVISKGHNQRHTTQRVSQHAEIIVLEAASTHFKSWKLEGTTLYVTLEPCLMCLGAILQSRVSRLVFALREPKSGAVVSTLNVQKLKNQHELNVDEGILSDVSEKLIQLFFKGKRDA